MQHPLETLAENSLSELKAIPGIGDAMQIVALTELSKRMRSGTIAE